MRVFKYTDHALTILKTRRIKLSSAHKLNDPFELSPTIPVDWFSETRIRQFLKRDDQVRRWYREEGAKRGYTNIKRYKRWYLANLDEKVELMRPRIPQNVEQVRKTFAERFDNYFRFFCASRRRDSILMWSHYAKNHEGFVIEFDTEVPLFKRLGKNFVRTVDYKDEKALFKPDFHRGPSFMEHLLAAACRKSPDWSYELEVRLIFPRGIPGAEEFFPIGANCIRSVVIGCKCPAARRKEMQAFLQDEPLKHISLWEAKLNRDAFKLDFELLLPGADEAAQAATQAFAQIESSGKIGSAP